MDQYRNLAKAKYETYRKEQKSPQATQADSSWCQVDPQATQADSSWCQVDPQATQADSSWCQVDPQATQADSSWCQVDDKEHKTETPANQVSKRTLLLDYGFSEILVRAILALKRGPEIAQQELWRPDQIDRLLWKDHWNPNTCSWIPDLWALSVSRDCHQVVGLLCWELLDPFPLRFSTDNFPIAWIKAWPIESDFHKPMVLVSKSLLSGITMPIGSPKNHPFFAIEMLSTKPMDQPGFRHVAQVHAESFGAENRLPPFSIAPSPFFWDMPRTGSVAIRAVHVLPVRNHTQGVGIVLQNLVDQEFDLAALHKELESHCILCVDQEIAQGRFRVSKLFSEKNKPVMCARVFNTHVAIDFVQ